MRALGHIMGTESNITDSMSSEEQLERMSALDCVARPVNMDLSRWPPGIAEGLNPQTYDFTRNGHLMNERFPEECAKHNITPILGPKAAAKVAFGGENLGLEDLTNTPSPDSFTNG